MSAKAVIERAFQFADQFSRALADMKDAPLTRPGPWGGNHPMWIAGHLAVIEGRTHKILFATPNPLEHWKPLFDWGTQPSDNPDHYPPFNTVLAEFAKLRAKTLSHLSTLTQADLDQPVKLPIPNFPIFDTVGNTLLTIAVHQCAHAGEAFVIRAAAGKPPFFTPTPALQAF